MNRRNFLRLAGAASGIGLSSVFAAKPPRPRIKAFEFAEATIAQLQRAMERRQLTARSLSKQYLARIEELDNNGINAIIELNPDAMAIAAALDRERKAKQLRGPLHGIPVLIKDNIDTHDRMRTSAGSLALKDSIAARDAGLVARLREAGAVILAKTNLSERSNFRSSRSTSGWSGRGGLTRNPYALDRNPSGSSAGSAAAVSANFAAVAVGTETDGSILSPSSVNGIVGIKPTVGLISRSGIIPISRTQDTAGPMARCVADAAALLSVLVGRDSRDEATAAGPVTTNYTNHLDADGLRGARIGVARQYFGFHPRVDKIMEEALAAMKSAGALLVDPADIPSRGKFSQHESEILHYEFKAGLNEYLAALVPEVPVHTLAELIEFNERNAEKEMPFFGQELFVRAQNKGPLTDQKYLDAVEACRRLTRDEGIDATLRKHDLAAIVAPSTGPAHLTDLAYGDRGLNGTSSVAAAAGYPTVTVPAGFVFELPVGISFIGTAWSEPILIKLAYSFEQLTRARRAPQFLASATLGDA
jgi:amidase